MSVDYLEPSNLFVREANKALAPYESKRIELEYVYNIDFGAYKLYINVLGRGDWTRSFVINVDQVDMAADPNAALMEAVRIFTQRWRTRETEPESNIYLGEN